jgi:hypothetical protein
MSGIFYYSDDITPFQLEEFDELLIFGKWKRVIHVSIILKNELHEVLEIIKEPTFIIRIKGSMSKDFRKVGGVGEYSKGVCELSSY